MTQACFNYLSNQQKEGQRYVPKYGPTPTDLFEQDVIGVAKTLEQEELFTAKTLSFDSSYDIETQSVKTNSKSYSKPSKKRKIENTKSNESKQQSIMNPPCSPKQCKKASSKNENEPSLHVEKNDSDTKYRDSQKLSKYMDSQKLVDACDSLSANLSSFSNMGDEESQRIVSTMLNNLTELKNHNEKTMLEYSCFFCKKSPKLNPIRAIHQGCKHKLCCIHCVQKYLSSLNFGDLRCPKCSVVGSLLIL